MKTKILCMGFALLAAGRAGALGLGEAIGNAVVGEALRIEIPLLGGGSETPSPACFRVVPPVAEIGSDFVLRNARVDVVGERGGSKLVVTTAAPVREPLVGFAVSAGCSFGVSRDYVLLSAMPAVAPTVAPLATPAAAPAAPAAAPPAAPVSAPTAAAAPSAAPSPSQRAEAQPAHAPTGETLHLDADATLTALARKKYPLQPKAREKFVRMMMQANPQLAAGDAPIAAGTVLQVPPGLPLRREGSAAPPARPAAPGPAVAAVAAPQAKPSANPRKDRLMLSAPAASEARLLDEAERLTAMMLEQAKAQAEMLETIARLEANYVALRKEFTRLENQLNAVEAERKAEKAAAAANAMSPDLVMLMLAVLGGGAMGGLGLHLYQRRKARPETKPEAPWWTAAEKAVPPKPRPKLPSLGQPPAAAPQADVLDFHTQPQQGKS